MRKAAIAEYRDPELVKEFHTKIDALPKLTSLARDVLKVYTTNMFTIRYASTKEILAWPRDSHFKEVPELKYLPPKVIDGARLELIEAGYLKRYDGDFAGVPTTNEAIYQVLFPEPTRPAVFKPKSKKRPKLKKHTQDVYKAALAVCVEQSGSATLDEIAKKADMGIKAVHEHLVRLRDAERLTYTTLVMPIEANN